jgi:hypothetical protein
MFGFLRHRPGHVEHTVPPQEPGAHYRAWISREARVLDIDQEIREEWAVGNKGAVDWLLDTRNKVRPARPAEVPVIPGRTS